VLVDAALGFSTVELLAVGLDGRVEAEPEPA